MTSPQQAPAADAMPAAAPAPAGTSRPTHLAVVAADPAGRDPNVGPAPDGRRRRAYGASTAGAVPTLPATDAGQAVLAPAVPPRTLLAADPLLEMLDALEADVAVLRDLTPRSDVPDALARVATRLRAALARAADGDVWVTTEDAARVRRLSESAVRWRIKHGKLRAEWRGGRWWIRRADVEAM